MCDLCLYKMKFHRRSVEKSMRLKNVQIFEKKSALHISSFIAKCFCEFKNVYETVDPTAKCRFCFRLPSPYNKQSSGVGGAGGGTGGSTSIPLPATVTATRRCPPDKVRPAPTPTHQSQLGKFSIN